MEVLLMGCGGNCKCKAAATGMTFAEAYQAMKNGAKIAMPEWKGYWIWESNTIKIHLASGDVMDIRDTEMVDFTFGFICRNDWVIVD